ncbi:hypothetical protein EV672_1276 [Aquabacterium commune]|uniref:Uncharacterized protein n=1 Tax=Aquabacterium commune TaxID=70586 RepID=A0A4R6QY52_9BURK|nr:hypothetical protein [Aquabacterium commune]TDP78173.1 hypothetical protein EV672_1276 [Aquabacterium commune]
MKPFSIFQLTEALHLRVIRRLDPRSHDDLVQLYELRNQSRALNPQLMLIEPLSLGKWIVRKALVIVGLIGIAWVLAALNAQGLNTWGFEDAAEAFAKYVQVTGAAGMKSDLSNCIAIVLALEGVIAAVLPGWFFNWQNPVDNMVQRRLVEHETKRARSRATPASGGVLA